MNMKKKRRLAALLALLLTLLPLSVSCSKKTDYADGIPCAELMDTVVDQVPVNFGYETFGGDHLRYYFENTRAYDDACLRYSTLSEDINEIGIFHTPDKESQDKIKTLTDGYLATLLEEQRAFIESYAPEEIPKLEKAEVRTFGNYTVYAILSDDDRQTVFETVERKLKRET